MDTGNIMENQLQDQIDAYDSEEKIQYEIEKAIAKDEAIELLLDAKKAIFEKAPVKYVQKGSELKRVFEQEVENTLFYIDEMIDSRIESIKGTITF